MSCHHISHSPNLSVSPPSCLPHCETIFANTVYMTQVGVQQCWIMAQTFSHCSMSKSVMISGVHPAAHWPADFQGGGGEVIGIVIVQMKNTGLVLSTLTECKYSAPYFWLVVVMVVWEFLLFLLLHLLSVLGLRRKYSILMLNWCYCGFVKTSLCTESFSPKGKWLNIQYVFAHNTF